MISLKNFATSIVAAVFLGYPAYATEAHKATSLQRVELKPSSDSARRFDGTLSNKKIVMLLSETSVEYTGGYAYISTSQASNSPKWIDLAGKKRSGGTVLMTETVADKVTGQFKGKFEGNSFSGVWTSPGGKTFPFSLVERTSGLPSFIADIEGASGVQQVRKISAYNGKKLLQSFPVSMTLNDPVSDLQYQTLDYNFDGYPDFYLGSEDSGQVFLLFDAKANSFVVAPTSLRKIRVTGVKYSTNELYEEWSRSGYNGMNVYKFVNGNYCLIEQNSVAPLEKSSLKKYPVSQCKNRPD